jgi:hypothetical protein
MKQPVKMMLLLLLATIAVTSAGFGQNGDAVRYGLTSGRLESILIGVLGITSLILSIRHFRSSKNAASTNKRRSIMIAGSLGLICMILAGVHIANSTGGFGTGSGKAGAIVAIAFGLTAMVISGFALNRLIHARN